MYRIPQNRRRPETPQQRRVRQAREEADYQRRRLAAEIARYEADERRRQQYEAEAVEEARRYAAMTPCERAVVDAARAAKAAKEEAEYLAAQRAREERERDNARRMAERYWSAGT